MSMRRVGYAIGIMLVGVVGLWAFAFGRPHGPPNLNLLQAAIAHTERVIATDDAAHRIRHDAGSIPDLTYACSDTAPEPIARARRARSTDLAIIATFADGAAAEHAASTLRSSMKRREWAIAFGQTVLVSHARSGVRAEDFVQQVHALGGELLVRDAEVAKDFKASIACTAPDDDSASHLFQELDGYAWAPPRSARAPWAPDDRTAEEIATDRRARATYRTLTRELARELAEANVPLLARRHLRAKQRHEAETAARTHRRMMQRKQAALRRLEPTLRAHHALLDHDLIDRYLAHHEEHRDGRFAHDWYAWTAGLIDPSTGGRPHPSVRRDHLAPSARIHNVTRHGRTLHLHGIDFYATQVGLPALASYLCAQRCSDIRYALAEPSQDGVKTQSAKAESKTQTLND